MLSRRSFLNGTLGAGACAGIGLTQQAAAQAPGAQVPGAQPVPRRMIVDSQVHLWLAQGPDRPWPADGVKRAAGGERNHEPDGPHRV